MNRTKCESALIVLNNVHVSCACLSNMVIEILATNTTLTFLAFCTKLTLRGFKKFQQK